MYVTQASVLTLEFTSASPYQFAGVLKNNPLIYFVMDNTGALINSMVISGRAALSEIIYPQGLVFDKSLRMIYGIQNVNGFLEIGCFQAGATAKSLPATLKFVNQFSTGVTSGVVTAMEVLSPAEDVVFVGGMLVLTNNQRLLLFHQFHMGPGAPDHLIYYTASLGINPTQYYFVKAMSYSDGTVKCNNILNFCLQHTDSSSSNTILLGTFVIGDGAVCGGQPTGSADGKYDWNAINQGYAKNGQLLNKPSITQYTECLGILSTTSPTNTTVLLHIPALNQPKLCIYTSSFTSQSAQSLACQNLNSIIQSANTIFSMGRAYASGEAVMVGQLKQIIGDTGGLTPVSSLQSVYQGFVLSFLNKYNCLTITPVATTHTLAYNSTFNFTWATFTLTTTSSSFANSALTMTSTINQQSNAKCVQQAVCTMVQISPSTLTNQVYNLGSLSASYTVPAFSLSTSSSTCTDSITLTYSAVLYPALTALPTFMTFNPATRVFTVSTSSIGDVGTYQIQVSATAINGQYSSFTFTLQVVATCNLAVISCTSNCVLPAQTYTIRSSPTTLTVPLSTLGLSVANCVTQITLTSSLSPYTFSSSFTSSPSNSNLVLDSSWVFSSSDNGMAQNLASVPYTITIQVSVLYNSVTYSPTTLTFLLTIVSQCSLSAITTTNPISNPFSYDISTGTASTLINLWTQTVSGCPSIAYTLTPSSPYISIGAASVSVSASVIAAVGNYTFTLVGVITGYTSTQQSKTFTLSITNKCGTTAITTHTCASPTLTLVNDPSLSVTFTAWSNPYSSNCGPFTYSALVVESSLALSPSTSPISFDAASRTFSVASILFSEAGTYTIQITGVNTLYSESATTSFLIEIFQDCPNIFLITTAVPNQSYTLRSTPLQVNIPQFTTYAGCEPFTYSFSQANLNSVATSSSAFTFDPITLTLTVSSSNYLDAGSYIITVTGALTNYLTNSIPVSFQVDISDSCPQTNITFPDSGQEFYYYLYSGPYTISFSQFTESLGGCGAFTYSASLIISNQPTALTSLFSFSVQSDETLQLTFDCESVACISTYQVQVTGALSGNYPSASFLFKIHSVCQVSSLNQVGAIQKYTGIQVAGLTKQLTFLSYTQTPNCGQTITYEAMKEDNTQLPSFIVFDNLKRQFTIKTSSYNDSGNYSIKIVAKTVNSGGLTPVIVTDQSQIFNVEVIDDRVYNSAPYFETTPLNQYVIAGAGTIEYSLPPVLDEDGDKIEVTANLGKAGSFIQFYSRKLFINPHSSDVGNYTIILTLKDLVAVPLTTSYTIIVEVMPSDLFGSASTRGSYVTGTYKALNVDKNLIATILSFDSNGVVTVGFIPKVYVPSNFTLFDKSVLGITLLPGESVNSSELNFTWVVTNFSQSQMLIQINFAEPILISSYFVILMNQSSRNQTKFKFNSSEMTSLSVKKAMLLSQTHTKSKKTFPSNLNRIVIVYLQLSALSQSLTSGGQVFSSSLKSLSGISMGLSLLMGTSLQFLWQVINSIQIINHFPLLSFDMPSNTFIFFSYLISFSQFDLLPSTKMQDILFDFNQTNMAPFNDKFDQMDIFCIYLFFFPQPFYAIIAKAYCRTQEASFSISLESYFSFSFFSLSRYYLQNLRSNLSIFHFNRIGSVYQYLLQKMIFGVPLRFFLESYIEFSICGMLNARSLQLVGLTNKIATAYTLVVIMAVIFAPLALTLLFKNSEKLKQQDYINKYGSLYEDLKFEKNGALFYIILFLVRRIIFAAVAVLCSDFPFGQVQIMMFTSIFLMMHMIGEVPFESRLAYKMEIFNEFIILVESYHLMLYTDFLPDKNLQYSAGTSAIIFSLLGIFMNTLVMVVQMGYEILRLVRKLKAYLSKRKSVSVVKDIRQRKIIETIDQFQPLEVTQSVSSQPKNGSEVAPTKNQMDRVGESYMSLFFQNFADSSIEQNQTQISSPKNRKGGIASRNQHMDLKVEEIEEIKVNRKKDEINREKGRRNNQRRDEPEQRDLGPIQSDKDSSGGQKVPFHSKLWVDQNSIKI